MKSKFLVVLTAVFVLAFGAAVFAFNKTNNSGITTAAASCCAKSDNCPMKNKGAQTVGTEKDSTVSCCDNANCCCKSGACPMKASGEKSSTDCCANCCGGSCPMKNKAETETAVSQTQPESCPQKTAGS